MLIVTMAMLAAVPQNGPATPNAGAIPARCRAGDGLAKQPGPRVGRSQKLNELPPANQYYALYRRGPDGCPDPIVLRKGVGNPAKPASEGVRVPRTRTPR